MAMRNWLSETMAVFGRRFGVFLRREKFDGDLDEEMRLHLELREQELRESGATPEAAHTSARRQFGNSLALREASRDAWGWSWLEHFGQDLRFALRRLRQSPGFTVVAVLTLALGIGANTAIFSMVHGILLGALPYTQPERLYSIHEVVPQMSSYGSSLPVNGGNFLEWRKDSHAFSAMTLMEAADGSLLGMGNPQWLYGAAITSEFFSVLGVQPAAGRTFLPGDGSSGGKPEIILTYRLWREQFHSDPDILGKVVNLGGRGRTVIGVLPSSFVFPRILAHDPQYLVPFPWTKWNSRPGIGTHNFFVIARLKAGVTPREAKAQLDVIEARIARRDSGGKFSLYATLTPLKTDIVGSSRNALWMLTAAAGLLLLIVCVNLANLLLVKNSKRGREVALRSVLGAGRGRLARQLLAESLMLASVGGGLGLVFAEVGLRFLVRNAPVGVPRVNQVHLDATVLWFTAAVTLFATVTFGLLPAMRLSRAEPSDTLKSEGLTATAGRATARLRGALVIGEIALCAAMLPGCLLLIQSLRRVVLANQWLNDEQIMTADLLVHVPASQIRTPQDMFKAFRNRNRIFTAIEERIRHVPGVENAGFTSEVPLEGFNWGDGINIRELPRPGPGTRDGEFRFVSPGYFQAIGLPLVEGRFFSRRDQGQSVAVISESIAREVFAGRNPLGMHINCGDFGFSAQNWCRVVGVAGDVRDQSDHANILAAYFPLWLYSSPFETLVVRTTLEPTAAAQAIRRAVWSADPRLAIPQEKTLKAILGNAEASRRYETTLAVLFAFCAVGLALLGLYAVVSYSVSLRHHEIGVRMALGAQRRDVLGMVFREAIWLAGVGILAGMGGALALTRFLRSLLFGVEPTDPQSFLGVAIALALVALLACYLPARRAMMVDPLVALRHE